MATIDIWAEFKCTKCGATENTQKQSHYWPHAKLLYPTPPDGWDATMDSKGTTELICEKHKVTVK